MSLENLKPSPNSNKYVCTTKKNMRAATQKKLCTHIFFEFGESLEIFQTHDFSSFVFFENIFVKNDIKQTFLCEFGVSLEILQARSKLICFHCFLLFHCFFGKEE